MNSVPVTPQQPSKRHSYAHSISHFRSPASPASPYTPFSLRSFASNSSSSTLTTPSSVRSAPLGVKRLSFLSPQVVKASPLAARDRSLADIAPSWRSRASEHGIKVSASNDDMSMDDDISFSDANNSGFITTEEALLPPPFLSTHRRRALSQSQASSFAPHRSAPRTPLRPPPVSPLARRTLNSLENNIATATPPQNRNLAKHLKLKGSLTDPAHTRRREAFGVVPQPSQNIPTTNNQDHSLDLFDIDENDYEYEYEYDDGESQDYDYSFNAGAPQDYAPYPILNNPLPAAPVMPMFGQPTFADPFNPGSNGLNRTIADSVDQHFHQFQSQYALNRANYTQPHTMMNVSQPISPFMPSTPASGNVSKSSTPRAASAPTHPPPSSPLPDIPPTSCSVCSRANPARLAILLPCSHPLCSSCLTSALNIVGEKDMECAVCKQGVDDFKLIAAGGDANGNEHVPEPSKAAKRASISSADDARGKSFLDPLLSSPGSVVSSSFTGGLESAFEWIGQQFANDGDIRASTPPPASMRRSVKIHAPATDNVVLRIDNVPWDITPPTISAWLQQPVERAHVLLDRKGKTQSHAFVEVKSEEVAGAILRGETPSKRPRGAVLGRGRRARGVTITRSSQEELMGALFPSWRGPFDGSRPSLAGLGNGRVIDTLEGGLMTDSEISSLLYLVRSPDAHFLKVPCLPFHSLMSILSKFPADDDSRVFWSPGFRDSLYDVTYAAVQVLLNHIEKKENETEFTMELAEELVRTAVHCPAFTPQQTSKLADLLDTSSSSGEDSADADIEDADEQDEVETSSSVTVASNADSPSTAAESPDDRSIGDLAREFGMEAHVVQALAQRLAEARLR